MTISDEEVAHLDSEELVLTEFRALFDKMRWLNGLKMSEALKKYSTSEVHCVEAIANIADPNVTKLAEALYMTRSALSKLTKKMMAKQYIKSYRKPDNKKEIYFELTDEGQQMNAIHERLHAEFRQRDHVVFERVTAEQFEAMRSFIKNYDHHLDQEIAKLNLGK